MLILNSRVDTPTPIKQNRVGLAILHARPTLTRTFYRKVRATLMLHGTDDPAQTKVCKNCGETKPISDYYFVKNRNKHSTKCKKCYGIDCAEDHRNKKQKEPNVFRDRSRRYRASNPEKIKEYDSRRRPPKSGRSRSG